METTQVATQSTGLSQLSQKVRGFNDNLSKYENTVASLLGEKYGMSAKEFTVSVMNAVKKQPKLLDCDPKTLFGAILLSAELGLKPNTPEGFAYIIPYGKEAQFQIGYKGLIEIAYRSPMVKAIKGITVYENEFYQEHEDNTYSHIAYTGMDLNIMQLKQARENFLRKTMKMDESEIQKNMTAYGEKLKNGKGEYVLAYAVCYVEGLELPIWTSVTRDVLDKIQKLSKSNGSFSPYNNGTDVHNSMQFKAAIKKLFKFLPKQALQEVAKAIDVDDKMMAGSVAVMTEDGVVEIIEDVTDDQRETIERLFMNCTYDDKQMSIIKFKINNGMTKGEADEVISNLRMNQGDTPNQNATDAKNNVAKAIN